jgi:hypothetical protein
MAAPAKRLHIVAVGTFSGLVPRVGLVGRNVVDGVERRLLRRLMAGHAVGGRVTRCAVRAVGRRQGRVVHLKERRGVRRGRLLTKVRAGRLRRRASRKLGGGLRERREMT